MKLVIALGGNALLTRGEPLDVDVQRANVAKACESIPSLTSEHRVIMTHGNRYRCIVIDGCGCHLPKSRRRGNDNRTLKGY
jgi:hypothetical protein